MEADIKTPDRGEPSSAIEPLLLGEGRHRAAITDLALDLAQKSAGFRRSLPPSLVTSLADLVRAMNCYYSNLIEGHDTHPVDIERALKNDYSQDPHKRDLQLEAKAHIAVQKWIDGGGLNGSAIQAQGICEIHRRFCELPRPASPGLPGRLGGALDAGVVSREAPVIQARKRRDTGGRPILLHRDRRLGDLPPVLIGREQIIRGCRGGSHHHARPTNRPDLRADDIVNSSRDAPTQRG
jgi:hypothetical protein